MRVAKVLSVIFGILTICGAIYLFYTDGRANAGYAVVPMVFTFIFLNWARSGGTKNKETK